MIKRISAVFLVVAALAFSIQNAYSAVSPEAPKLSVTTNKKTFAPGESGYITIKFKKGEHVKIPKDPPVVVTINGVSNDGLDDYSDEAGDYINSGIVRLKFTVPSDAAIGTTIKAIGFVKFGYCSTDDGTCRLAKQNYSVKIKVK